MKASFLDPSNYSTWWKDLIFLSSRCPFFLPLRLKFLPCLGRKREENERDVERSKVSVASSSWEREDRIPTASRSEEDRGGTVVTWARTKAGPVFLFLQGVESEVPMSALLSRDIAELVDRALETSP